MRNKLLNYLRITIFVVLMIGNIGIFAFGKRIHSTRDRSLEDLLHAICMVESHCDDGAIGDGGKSIGRYQIGYQYWLDAGMPDGVWRDCKDPDYAERVVRRYWARYAPDAIRDNDFKKLARVHNGGPQGHLKNDTLKYWEKVEMELDK